MCEGVSERKAAVPSTLLHPCSIFQGCHAHLHVQVRKGSLERSRNLPKVTQRCRCCWPGCWHCRQPGILRLLPRPHGHPPSASGCEDGKTGRPSGQAPRAACPSPWLSVKLIKWATTGRGQTSGLPSRLTPALLGAAPEDRLLLPAATCQSLSVIGED